MEDLNRLFKLLLSQEDFTVESVQVKAQRQRPLIAYAEGADKGREEVVSTSVTATLESDESVEEYVASAARLVADLVEARFEVTDIVVRLSPQEAELAKPPTSVAFIRAISPTCRPWLRFRGLRSEP